MLNLPGTNNDPGLVESPFDAFVEQVNQESYNAEKEALQDRLQRWTDLQKTEYWTAINRLVAPIMAHLDYLLSQSPQHLFMQKYITSADQSEAACFYAECRGQKRVWQTLKNEPQYIVEKLNELDKLSEKSDSGWKKRE